MKKIAAALIALAIAGCAQQLGDGSRLEPTGKTVRINQGEQFCRDNPGDAQCSR
ncbi:hypothetical protein [Sphingomonas melonis]|uniref:hypothetical protein n=1 Tax=Sphingomonas melonis TaxID=152682 RepID=UPI001F8668FD|nr:hypothetical protein [Candidatus Sphingomonas excrementigallinarum]